MIISMPVRHNSDFVKKNLTEHLDLPQHYLAKQYCFLLTLQPRASRFLNFCRIFPLEVERKFKSWFLNLYDELVVTNWLNAHYELVVARFGNKNSVFNSLYFYCIYIALFTETCIFGIV